MVTLQKYLEVYLKVMPQRMQEMKGLFDAKRDLDKRVVKSTIVQNRILEIIGEDLNVAGIGVRSAENRSKKTIRRMLFKIHRSTDYLENGIYQFNLEMESRIKKKEAKVTPSMDYFIKIHKEYLSFLGKFRYNIAALIDSYNKQAHHLRESDMDSYKLEVRSCNRRFLGLKELGELKKMNDEMIQLAMREIKALDSYTNDFVKDSFSIGIYLIGVVVSLVAIPLIAGDDMVSMGSITLGSILSITALISGPEALKDAKWVPSFAEFLRNNCSLMAKA